MNKFELELEFYRSEYEEEFDFEEEERHYQEMMENRYIEPNIEWEPYDYSDFDGWDCDLEMKEEFGVMRKR